MEEGMGLKVGVSSSEAGFEVKKLVYLTDTRN